MLNLLRQISRMDSDLHNKVWTKRIGSLLKQKTVLIIGFGNIGQRVSELLAPFDVNIIVADPYVNKANIKFEVMSLSNAIPLADVITLHCNADCCVISKKEFNLMKKGALLLNASRGYLVDEKALVEALKENRVSGVWFDTFEEEPYSGTLTEISTALLTPHIASYTIETRRNMEMEAVQNLIAALKAQKQCLKPVQGTRL